jgi:hypothetical protein
MDIVYLDSVSAVKAAVLAGKTDTASYDWQVDFSYRDIGGKKYRLPFAVPVPLDDKPETFVAMLQDLLAKQLLKSSYGELYQYGISLFFRRVLESKLSAGEQKRKTKFFKDLQDSVSPEVWAAIQKDLQSKETPTTAIPAVREDLYKEMEESRVLTMRVRKLIPQAE